MFSYVGREKSPRNFLGESRLLIGSLKYRWGQSHFKGADWTASKHKRDLASRDKEAVAGEEDVGQGRGDQNGSCMVEKGRTWV